MLKLEHISVSFHHTPILKDISCTIEDGDFIVIVGANGAGKTTLFDVIAGKVKPHQGTIYLNNIDITRTTEQKRAILMSRLFQNPRHNCVSSMTVAQNLAMALYKGHRAGLTNGMQIFHKRHVDEIINSFNIDLSALNTRLMGSLSGGQRQLISFIMATLVRPHLLLLDEPTAALDPTAATKLLLFATEYIKQHTITTLLITHDPYIALTIGNKVWVLEEGKITKKFNQQDKKNLSPQDLIGHIDYEALMSTS